MKFFNTSAFCNKITFSFGEFNHFILCQGKTKKKWEKIFYSCKVNEYSQFIQKIRKQYLEIYKENENVKLRLQKPESYRNQEELIKHNKQAMKNFPHQYRSKKRKYKQPIDGSSSSSSSSDDPVNYYMPKKKKKKEKKTKYDDDINGSYTEEEKKIWEENESENETNSDH